jgi:hypothetical protein
MLIMKKIVIFFILSLTMNLAIAGQNDCAIVVMHGKWGLPCSI